MSFVNEPITLSLQPDKSWKDLNKQNLFDGIDDILVVSRRGQRVTHRLNEWVGSTQTLFYDEIGLSISVDNHDRLIIAYNGQITFTNTLDWSGSAIVSAIGRFGEIVLAGGATICGDYLVLAATGAVTSHSLDLKGAAYVLAKTFALVPGATFTSSKLSILAANATLTTAGNYEILTPTDQCFQATIQNWGLTDGSKLYENNLVRVVSKTGTPTTENIFLIARCDIYLDASIVHAPGNVFIMSTQGSILSTTCLGRLDLDNAVGKGGAITLLAAEKVQVDVSAAGGPNYEGGSVVAVSLNSSTVKVGKTYADVQDHRGAGLAGGDNGAGGSLFVFSGNNATIDLCSSVQASASHKGGAGLAGGNNAHGGLLVALANGELEINDNATISANSDNQGGAGWAAGAAGAHGGTLIALSAKDLNVDVDSVIAAANSNTGGVGFAGAERGGAAILVSGNDLVFRDTSRGGSSTLRSLRGGQHGGRLLAYAGGRALFENVNVGPTDGQAVVYYVDGVVHDITPDEALSLQQVSLNVQSTCSTVRSIQNNVTYQAFLKNGEVRTTNAAPTVRPGSTLLVRAWQDNLSLLATIISYEGERLLECTVESLENVIDEKDRSLRNRLIALIVVSSLAGIAVLAALFLLII